ncbi:MAG: VOC family protein [Bryobacter sp.]|jgi:hypothetical protein|nr:VOC family protein [Bryobacter sp. CoA8 C33]
MSQTKPNHQIDYVELPAKDLPRTKEFYSSVFGWKFEDYGPEYTSFFDGRLGGGFHTHGSAPAKGILLVIYAEDLAAAQDRIKTAGGLIVKDTFSFPGGRRFHFTDPNGNELAVWSE